MNMSRKNSLSEKVVDINVDNTTSCIDNSRSGNDTNNLTDTYIMTYTDINMQVVDLQMTIAHLELSVEKLDAVVTRQDRQIQTMQRQLQLMYKHIESQQSEEGIAPFDVMADKPPHY